MFRVIDNDFLFVDRQKFKVYKIDGKKGFKDEQVTRFVISNGMLKSEAFSASGNFVSSINEEFEIDGQGIVIEMFGFKMTEQSLSVFNKEVPGNLSYIDGCSNSVLIPPPRNGDPCLNYLYFPPGIDQTFHVHPSVRIGMIFSGSGIAELKNKTYELKPFTPFILDRFCLHRFKTDDSSMSLIAFHPDSDDGPTDEFNPMKTRTYISK
jgi:hypothetical protein